MKVIVKLSFLIAVITFAVSSLACSQGKKAEIAGLYVISGGDIARTILLRPDSTATSTFVKANGTIYSQHGTWAVSKIPTSSVATFYVEFHIHHTRLIPANIQEFNKYAKLDESAKSVWPMEFENDGERGYKILAYEGIYRKYKE